MLGGIPSKIEVLLSTRVKSERIGSVQCGRGVYSSLWSASSSWTSLDQVSLSNIALIIYYKSVRYQHQHFAKTWLGYDQGGGNLSKWYY
jgi:hypothetical protein